VGYYCDDSDVDHDLPLSVKGWGAAVSLLHCSEHHAEQYPPEQNDAALHDLPEQHGAAQQYLSEHPEVEQYPPEQHDAALHDLPEHHADNDSEREDTNMHSSSSSDEADEGGCGRLVRSTPSSPPPSQSHSCDSSDLNDSSGDDDGGADDYDDDE
jgi:hypothetical protein